MLITFDIVAQIQLKVNFWIAPINTFRMMYNLFGFGEVRILPLIFGNDVIMTSFVIVELPDLPIF